LQPPQEFRVHDKSGMGVVTTDKTMTKKESMGGGTSKLGHYLFIVDMYSYLVMRKV